MSPAADPPIPPGFVVLPAPDGGTVVRRPWRTGQLVGLALLVVVWNALLVVWYAAGLAAPRLLWPMLVFALGHVGVGVGLTYFLLASLVNRTDITASGAGVRVWSGPAPWVGNRLIPAAAIWQVWVRAREDRRGRLQYRVTYAGPDEQEHLLVVSTDRADQAAYLAHVIRRTLRLRAPA